MHAPMNDDDRAAWIAQARQHTEQKTAAAQRDFGVGSHGRHQTDLQTATIRFFDAADVEQACAEIQVAGSWSPDSATWMWGWENESVPDVATARLDALREVGRRRHVNALLAHVQDCDEDEAWNLASLAAEITDAQCVYRVGGARNQSFLLLFNLRRTA